MKYFTVTSVLLTVTTLVALFNLLTGNILGAGLMFISAGSLAYGTMKLNKAKKMVDENKVKMLL